MPKATLEFTLPEDRVDFENAANANRMSDSINEFYRFLRSKEKYGDYKTEEASNLINEIYSEYLEEMSEFIP